MQTLFRKIPLLIAGAFLLVAAMLTGCESISEREAREQDPQFILAQAKQAFQEQNYQQVFQLLFPLATIGNDQAQYTLGYLYYHGLGVEKSDSQAMNWIQRAASQGNPKAIEALK